MKTWQKILSGLLAGIAIIMITGIMFAEKPCCVCSSFRYHAPCLIDLKTGELVELDLYFPHPTKVAELADPQPEMGTFSYVRLGNVTGTKVTDSKIIELNVPAGDKVSRPALCKTCRKQIKGSHCRYIMADLYDMNYKQLILIEGGTHIAMRCYEIIMRKIEEKSGAVITVRGTLND